MGTSSKTGAVMRGLGRGLVVVGAAAAGVVGMGVKLASDMQQAEIAFTQFLGSGEKAKAFLQTLADFAAKTPFEFPELRDAASKMLAVGVASEDIVPILTTVGDSVAAIGGSGENIQRAILAIQKMQLQGRVTNETLMQLNEAGIPATKALAEALGITTTEAMDRVSKGQIKVNDLLGVLKDQGVPSLEAAAGMMDKQSQSLEGLFSTLKDTVGLALTGIAQPLVEGLTKALPGLTDTITKVMGDIGPVFAKVFASVIDVVAELLPVLAPIVKILGGLLATALKALLPVIKVLAPPLLDIAKILGGILKIAGEAFAQILAALAPLMVELLVASMPLIEAILELFKAIEPLLPLIIQLMVIALRPTIMTMIIMSRIAAFLVSWIAKIVTAITNWFKKSENITAIGEVFKAVGRVIMSVIRFIINVITTGWNVVKTVTSTVWNAIKTVVGSVWRAITTVVRGAIGGVKTVITTVMGTIKTVWSNIWNGLKSVAVGIWDAIKGAASGALDFIVGIINNIIDGINTLIHGFNLLPGPDIPEIPGLARGVKNFAGGFAIVGERGPELVYMKPHTDVFPNNVLRDIGRRSQGTPIAVGQGTAGQMTIRGTLMTPWGPSEIRAVVVEEIEANDDHKSGMARMKRPRARTG